MCVWGGAGMLLWHAGPMSGSASKERWVFCVIAEREVNLVQACEGPGGSALQRPAGPGPLALGGAAAIESPARVQQQNGTAPAQLTAEIDLQLPLPKTGMGLFSKLRDAASNGSESQQRLASGSLTRSCESLDWCMPGHIQWSLLKEDK